MANPDKPFGARLVGVTGASVYNAQTRLFSIPASDGTAVFVGDFVKSTGSADADGVPGVIQAAAGNIIRGVVLGFLVVPTNLETMHRLASTLRYAMVCEDPDAEYEIQEDGAAAVTAVGGNADIVVAAGSTVSGLSAMELDSSTATTSTAQLRILQFVQKPDNLIGTNGNWLVKINEHELRTAAGV